MSERVAIVVDGFRRLDPQEQTAAYLRGRGRLEGAGGGSVAGAPPATTDARDKYYARSAWPAASPGVVEATVTARSARDDLLAARLLSAALLQIICHPISGPR
jgi:hypothetical protein